MDEMLICPKCKDDAYEVSTSTTVESPEDGQKAVWKTILSCGCTVDEYLVWYDRTGWV